jgi:hypothetical protein
MCLKRMHLKGLKMPRLKDLEPCNSDNKCGIKCEWMQSKRVLVNPDGQVLPCCFFANVMYMYDRLGAPKSWTPKKEYGIEDQIMDVPRVEYNLFNKPLEEILESEWFTKTLPESWEDSDTLPRQCRTFCQIKKED